MKMNQGLSERTASERSKKALIKTLGMGLSQMRTILKQVSQEDEAMRVVGVSQKILFLRKSQVPQI